MNSLHFKPIEFDGFNEGEAVTECHDLEKLIHPCGYSEVRNRVGLPTDFLWYNIEVNCDNKNMFFSDPGLDLQILIWLFVISFAVAIFLYLKTRQILLAVLTFSVLANLSLWINSGSRFFDINNLNWIVAFTKFYWPILNLALLVAIVIKFFQKKYAK